MKNFNNFESSLKFTFECDRISINFLDLNLKLYNSELTTSFYKQPIDCHQYLHYRSSHSYHIKLFIVKLYRQVVCVYLKKIL